MKSGKDSAIRVGRYVVEGGKVFERMGATLVERTTAGTANGQDLERFERALEVARHQREALETRRFYVTLEVRGHMWGEHVRAANEAEAVEKMQKRIGYRVRVAPSVDACAQVEDALEGR